MTTSRRKYEDSHGWITFEVNLTRAPHNLWFLLGEASSKCDHLANTPLQPSVAKELHTLYLAKGALATTAIEGNTLSESEVLAHLAGELILPKSKEYLAKEIDNIVAACRSLTDPLHLNHERALTVETICAFNRQVLHGLPLDEGVSSVEEGGTRVLDLLARLNQPPPTVVIKRSRSHRDDCRDIAAALRAGAFAVVDRPRDVRDLELMLEVLRRCMGRFYMGRWPVSGPAGGQNPGQGGQGRRYIPPNTV